jgi:hypothetical protein
VRDMPTRCRRSPWITGITSSARVSKDSGRLRLALVSVQYTFPLHVRRPHASRNATLFELLVTCQGTDPANRAPSQISPRRAEHRTDSHPPVNGSVSPDGGFFAAGLERHPDRSIGSRSKGDQGLNVL